MAVPPAKTRITLGVERYAEGDKLAKLPANAADGLEGWHVARNVNARYDYLANQSVDIAQFLGDPCPTLERFRRDAVEMVKFLGRH